MSASAKLQTLASFVSISISAILLIFNIRRIVFTIAVLVAGNKKESIPAGQEHLPDVLILVPCRDEARMIPGLCRTISQLDYPGTKYQVILIDDGSTDGTGKVMQQQVKDKPGWHTLVLPRNVGKALALNHALAKHSFGEIVYIFDADHRPHPEAIKRAVRYFDESKVAAVTGFTKVLNPTASPSSYYAAIESYTNQLVTTRAKDHLDLAPALLGSNCGYRRKTLLQCGGFRKDAFSEDSDLTVAFYNAGYRIRFAEDAISYQQVPESIRGYLKQHVRWGRGLNDVAREHSLGILQNQKLALPLRFELLLFTAGYLDRIALMGAGALAALSFVRPDQFPFNYRVILFSLLTPLAQIIALFTKERMPGAIWIRLPLIPVFFVLDIMAAGRAMLDTVFSRSRLWTKTERVTIH